MKKILVCLFLLIAVFLVACSMDDSLDDSNMGDGIFKIIESKGLHTIYEDTNTGCNYIYIHSTYAGGLSPIYESAQKIKGCYDN